MPILLAAILLEGKGFVGGARGLKEEATSVNCCKPGESGTVLARWEKPVVTWFLEC